MKKILGSPALWLAFIMLGPGISWAQQPASPKSGTEHAGRIPFLRCGFFAGRSGIAFGPTGYCEVNPAQCFGVYGIVGHSQVNGHQTHGMTASASDISGGIGAVLRSPEVKRLRFGVFGQVLGSGSQVSSSYQDRAGNRAEYKQSDVHSVVTLGAEIEWRLNRSLWLVARPGKNIRGGLAAETGNGFYFTVGVLGNPIPALKRLRKIF